MIYFFHQRPRTNWSGRWPGSSPSLRAFKSKEIWHPLKRGQRLHLGLAVGAVSGWNGRPPIELGLIMANEWQWSDVGRPLPCPGHVPNIRAVTTPDAWGAISPNVLHMDWIKLIRALSVKLRRFCDGAVHLRWHRTSSSLERGQSPVMSSVQCPFRRGYHNHRRLSYFIDLVYDVVIMRRSH